VAALARVAAVLISLKLILPNLKVKSNKCFNDFFFQKSQGLIYLLNTGQIPNAGVQIKQ